MPIARISFSATVFICVAGSKETSEETFNVDISCASRTMQLYQVIFTAIAFFAIALGLQGCGGCDEDGVKKCNTAMTTDLAKDFCGGYNTWVACIKAIDCCENDDIKQSVNSNAAMLKQMSCTNVATC